MLEMHVGVNEQHEDDVRIRQSILIGRFAEHVIAETVGDRGRERKEVGEDPGVDRMHAEIRERGQHFRVVVHFVEFPQQRHLVTEPVMIEPVAELVGEKEHHGDDRSRHVSRQGRRRHGTEQRHQPGNDAVGDELVGQHGPAEHHAVDEHVEDQIADVGFRLFCILYRHRRACPGDPYEGRDVVAGEGARCLPKRDGRHMAGHDGGVNVRHWRRSAYSGCFPI
jgi:hypothetical protein